MNWLTLVYTLFYYLCVRSNDFHQMCHSKNTADRIKQSAKMVWIIDMRFIPKTSLIQNVWHLDTFNVGIYSNLCDKIAWIMYLIPKRSLILNQSLIDPF